MKANPGGELRPEHVIGRDHTIKQLWRILQRQSVVLTAERRMGKTSTIKKMRAQKKEGWEPIYQDLEGVRSRLEFVEKVFNALKSFLSKQSQFKESVGELMKGLGGFEIKGFIKFPEAAKIHWKKLLEDTLLEISQQKDKRFLFLWDELPLMIENIKRDEGSEAAMELLDTLRAQRQTHSNLRMIFTGSIGLHHVLSDLKRAGYANAPTNDMYDLDLPPLEPEDAEALAQMLLEGERLQVEADAAKVIAAAVGCFPYYIHHVIDALAMARRLPRCQDFEGLVEAKLADDKDPWDMLHYRQRIDTYYSAEAQHHLALALLDALAVEPKTLTVMALLGHVKISPFQVDEETLRDLLQLLCFDNYVTHASDGYRFRHTLIRKWWILQRGLS